MSWTALDKIGRRLLAGLLLALCLSGPAQALGPFSHFTLAKNLWSQLGPTLSPGPAERERLFRVFLAGSMALDTGYYPGAEVNLANSVHLIKPWQVCRSMLALAATPAERAFALGWLSHALLDLRGHRELVNPLAGGSFSQHGYTHKQVEWGLDCWLLARPQGGWLWRVQPDYEPGLGLWARALAQVYRVQVPRALLIQAMEAELKEVRRLPYVFWLSGRLQRPGGWAGNALGWLLGHTARPAYVSWLEWRGKDLDVRAVFTARWPRPQDTAKLEQVLEQARQDTLALLTRPPAPWPSGNLDADPACRNQACPDAQAAAAWLKSLPPAP
ncbi:MAG: zinc dependent phospholipase C family protein [Thermodesulfobacteriota bacterium]